MRARSPAVGSANRRRRCRQHLATQGDVFLVAVFGEIMADAADTGDEQHGTGEAVDKDHRIVPGRTGHAAPGTRGMLRGGPRDVLL